MSETIKYSLSFQVVGGTTIPITGEIYPEAYEKIKIDIPTGTDDLSVNLQPDGTNLGEFLLIKASTYGSELTYKVNDASATEIVLDGPHVFIGKGAVGILDSSPVILLFSNNTGEDVTVEILLGRDATA